MVLSLAKSSGARVSMSRKPEGTRRVTLRDWVGTDCREEGRLGMEEAKEASLCKGMGDRVGWEGDLVIQRFECPGRGSGNQKQSPGVIPNMVGGLQGHLGTFQPVFVLPSLLCLQYGSNPWSSAPA